jgi:hypothetical protein
MAHSCENMHDIERQEKTFSKVEHHMRGQLGTRPAAVHNRVNKLK